MLLQGFYHVKGLPRARLDVTFEGNCMPMSSSASERQKRWEVPQNVQDSCTWTKVPPVFRQHSFIGFCNFKRS
jgi:hypothetical protein